MKILSSEETKLWCRQHGIAFSDRGMPSFPDSVEKFEIPEDAQKRVYLVSQVMLPFGGEPVLLVWFNDWAVWPSGQRMHVFDRFRMSYGETRWLIDSPGHVFDQGEIEDAISFVTLAALFLWDCYVLTPQVGSKPGKLLYLSHDEFGLTTIPGLAG